jgi:hypothetical protein
MAALVPLLSTLLPGQPMERTFLRWVISIILFVCTVLVVIILLSTSVFGHITFVQVSLRDSVKLHIQLVREHLQVKSVRCVVGGSMGEK